MSLALQLAARFRRSKKQSGFTSFISASSTLGIGLGCAVLIIMLSVMNGFERELRQSLLAYIPHGELFAVDASGLYDWQTMMTAFSNEPEVKQVQPYINATGLMQKGRANKAVELTAIDAQIANQSALISRIPQAQWQQFQINQKGLILGRSIIEKLSLEIGDQVQVLLPKTGTSKLASPDVIWLTLLGEIHLGGELDSFTGFMHLATGAEALEVTTGAKGLQIYYHDPFIASQKTRELGYRLNQHAYMSDWTRTQGHLYQDIQLVRFVVYIALTLVIAVACFNIVSSLVMAVNERQAEIAMLKTMGASNALIMATFVWQGMINGLIGVVFGSIAGVLIAQNLTAIARGFENLFDFTILSGDVYFIDFLPSQLHFADVMLTMVIALLLSVCATLYPALKAAKINPANVLGH
ncbi:lipoprotein-releasing ABC transporter permease subunit [Planctobacterium marinum]|uniref:Lipoprotein transporter subunit LolE n=1 Tax=Planctobacterium marinum TaxID=1631968 RepID=A0AA48KPJ4_9ALTE|nr:lipoprotein transporter subunit LolE [Planctobacterium marinum]